MPQVTLSRLLGSIRQPSRLLRYSVAVLNVTITLLLMLSISRALDVTASPFLLFFAPVIFSSLYGGREAGVLAVVLTALVIVYFLEPPIHSLAVASEGALRICVFVLEGIFFSSLISTVQTARRRVQSDLQKLRISEEQLRLALEAANMGTWEWNINSGKVRWSKNHELLFGFAPGTFSGTYEAFVECVHPEDRQLTAGALTHSMQSRMDNDSEFRVVWADGSIHWIASKGQFFYDDRGIATRMIGVVQDVSDRGAVCGGTARGE